MILTLLEAAIRALVVALTVWAGLRLFRVANVLALKAAWGLVLAAALAMPLAINLGVGWRVLPSWAVMRLPENLLPQAAKALPAALPAPASFAAPLRQEEQAPPPAHAKQLSAPPILREDLPPSNEALRQPAPAAAGPAAPAKSVPLSPVTAAFALYFAVCAVLLLRMAYGLALAIRLWRQADPVCIRPGCRVGVAFAPDIPLRSSARVASPVTVGSGVVLPACYAEWDAEKLRIVLAHEGSHIRQGDFYLQLLAGLYASLFWFSPLGWWLKRKLSELAETISDRAGLEEAASRSSYAQLLLEFAALPRPTVLGVAMARTSNLSRRIERLLNESSFRRAFAGGRRALLAVLLVPVALFASTALVRVEAAATAKPAAQVQAPVPVQESVAAPSPQPLLAEASLAVPAPVPAAFAAAASGSDFNFDRTLTVGGKAELSVATGSGSIHLTHGSAGRIHVVGHIHVNWGGSEERAREIAANPPIEQAGNVVRIGSHHENMNNIGISYEIEAPADASLSVITGSGDISDEGVGEAATLQTGSGSIRATGLHGGFKAQTGSGSIHVDQTGEGDVKAETGSGSIEIGEVRGGLVAETGSGEIKVKGRPTKDWKLETGSGSIEFWAGDAPVTIDASTGSGSIHSDKEMMVQGTIDRHHLAGKLNGGGPTVRMESGSGSIQIH
jgi:hypothetical protein